MQPMPSDVQSAFDAFPSGIRSRLVEVRATILAIADQDRRIGAITEALKWGEPAYLTQASGSGSTIRLGMTRGRPDRAAIYFICRTRLVDMFRERYGGEFEYVGNRAVLLPGNGEVARGALEMMLSAALTYHLRARGAEQNG